MVNYSDFVFQKQDTTLVLRNALTQYIKDVTFNNEPFEEMILIVGCILKHVNNF